MPTITTSLHHKYQPNLDVIWACREIGSNAIDGEERHRFLDTGALSLHYSKRSKTMTLRNDGITVPATALLMGTSESRQEEACIGQFGEGLPMALLVLARSDIPVTIYNGDEKWEPCITRAEQYGNEPVLAVKTRKMLKNRNGFEVHIKGIEPEEYEEFRSLFLRFDEDFDADQAVQRHEGSNEHVLLQPKYHGKVYNKGVFVMQRNDLMFGYNLDAELNRDRSLIDEWSLKNKLGILLGAAAENNDEAFADLVVASMFEDESGRLELSDEYSDMYYNALLRRKAQDEFIQRYGANSITVESEEERVEAEELGLRGVVVSPLLHRIMRQRFGTVASVREERKNSISKIWAASALNAAERHNLDTARLLLQSVYKPAQDHAFGVVSFHDPEVKFIFTEEPATVHVAHNYLLDFAETLASMARGSASLNGDCDMEKLLCCIIGQLVRGQGNAALALQLIGQEG